MNKEQLFRPEHLRAMPASEQTFNRVTDKKPAGSNTAPMNDISREELDAKLNAAEARMDARLERFQGTVERAISDFRLQVQPIQNVKSHIWSSVAVIMATVVAVAALSFAAFDSGRETASLVSEAKTLQEKNKTEFDRQLNELRAQTETANAALKEQLDLGRQQNEEALKLLQAIQANTEHPPKNSSESKN